MKLSVVIPALNEAAAIEETIQGIRDAVKPLGSKDTEIIVVNDGSDDDTGKLAEACGARVITNMQNMGYGYSLKRGILSATGEAIAIADADGTYPLDRLPDLYKVYETGFHMVVGQRTGKHYHESFIKMPSRIVLKTLVEFVAGRRIPDVNSGLRIFSRQEALECLTQLSDSFSFTTSITLAMMLRGKFVKYIPIDYHARIGNTKVRLIQDSLRTLQYIVRTALFYNPLKMFLAVCILFAIPGFVGAIIGFLFDMPSLELLGWAIVVATIPVWGIGMLAEVIRGGRDTAS